MRLRSVGGSGVEFEILEADYNAFMKSSNRLATNEGLPEYMETLYSLIDRCHALGISYDDLGVNE
jgi:hypothetical protein